MIKIDRHLLKKTDYGVKLVNGTTIEFSNAGKWKSVDCKSRAVPEALVPKAVRRHVDKNHAGLKIVKIEKKASGYHIGLSDGKLLKYNHLGHFTGFANAVAAPALEFRSEDLASLGNLGQLEDLGNTEKREGGNPVGFPPSAIGGRLLPLSGLQSCRDVRRL